MTVINGIKSAAYNLFVRDPAAYWLNKKDDEVAATDALKVYGAAITLPIWGGPVLIGSLTGCESPTDKSQVVEKLADGGTIPLNPPDASSDGSVAISLPHDVWKPISGDGRFFQSSPEIVLTSGYMSGSGLQKEKLYVEIGLDPTQINGTVTKSLFVGLAKTLDQIWENLSGVTDADGGAANAYINHDTGAINRDKFDGDYNNFILPQDYTEDQRQAIFNILMGYYATMPQNGCYSGEINVTPNTSAYKNNGFAGCEEPGYDTFMNCPSNPNWGLPVYVAKVTLNGYRKDSVTQQYSLIRSAVTEVLSDEKITDLLNGSNAYPPLGTSCGSQPNPLAFDVPSEFYQDNNLNLEVKVGLRVYGRQANGDSFYRTFLRTNLRSKGNN